MKRIHLFEFEDFAWFPHWLRTSLTRLIVVMHRLLGSGDELAGLIYRALKHTPTPAIVDLCSGSGGPMIEVVNTIRQKHRIQNLTLTLSDLYPNLELAQQINNKPDQPIRYLTTPVDATDVNPAMKGVRTMVGSMHHMRPEVARGILRDAKEQKQPICIFEISDNSFPIWLWWIALPLNFLIPFFITPLVRPLTWQQIVFTYLIPIIPLFFAWDGAVSNARTYTLEDLDTLLDGLYSDDYHWEKGRIVGKAKKLYLLGLPVLK
ncbi:hypothetical protein [Telluribacter sp. SYSU D00476]|uniref:hypothetical protein n=1 Tax=Telluribacter sp. SYSU D00476 TaxID=2811430 RepID=UPI001FF0E886|nr:hypothetical protein [Telluribacter sp. SYSU D00476]